MNIISLHPGLTELVYALDADSELVAVTKYCDYPAKVSEKTIIGDQDFPDFDSMEEHSPELILLLDQDEIKKQCELRGWNVLMYNPQTLDEVFFMFKDLGEKLNRNNEAQKLINSIKAKLSIIESKAGGETKKAAFDYEPELWLIEIAKKAGIELMPDASTLNNLKHFEPEHILLARHTPEQIDWSIPAVKNGNITRVQPTLVRPSSRLNELAQKLGEVVRPDRFSSFGSMMGDIEEWYEGTEPIDPKGQYEN